MKLAEMPDPVLAEAAASAPVLAATGLCVQAGAGGPLALAQVSLQLGRGCTVGLVGESGAGKSMIGRVLARQLPANFSVTAGSLLFQGQDLLALPAREHAALLGKRIAFIPQEPMTALNPVRTIGAHFDEHLARLGVPAAQRAARTEALLAEVRLPRPREIMGSYAFQLSGGMCQRVMIALAFASDPDLVVSDEATTALDASTQAHVISLLRRLQARRGTAVLFVTHDLSLASAICDSVVVLYAGMVCEAGPGKRVFGDPQHPYTRALLRAAPQQAEPGARLSALPGTMPDVREFPRLQGCRFAPRCPSAQTACGAAPPEPLDLDGTQVRCLYAGRLGVVAAPAAPPVRTVSLGADPFLVVKGLGMTYPGRRRLFGASAPVSVLRGVDLTIAPGEFVGVVGESGSGKSTLGRLIMGLEHASAGSILLNGEPLGPGEAQWERRRRAIQMVFQDPRSALNPRRAVRELVTQAMESRPHMRVDRERRARELVADVGLAPDVLPRYPAQMSGGQRQRVNIGRALCDVPQLLVADEIVSGLDVSVQAQVLNLLLALRASHKIALLLISHDLDVVAHLCSRVLVLYRGEVVEAGETASVFQRPAHPYTRSLLKAASSPAALLA